MFKPERRTLMVLGKLTIFRSCLALLLLATLSLGVAQAQPLERGVELSNGSKFVVDNEQLRTLGGIGKTDSLHPEIKIENPDTGEPDAVKALFQPQTGWENSFLIHAGSQLLRGSVEGSRFQQTSLLQAADIKVSPWGNSFLVRSQGSKEIHQISSESHQQMELEGVVKNLAVLSDDTAVAWTEKGFFQISSPSGLLVSSKIAQLDSFQMAEDVQWVQSDRALLVWSPKQWTVALCAAVPEQEDLMVRLHQLDNTLSVKTLGPNRFLATSEQSLDVLAAFEESRKFARPQRLSKDEDGKLRGFTKNGQLVLVTEIEEKPVSITLRQDGEAVEQALVDGSIHHLVVPNDLNERPPVLFVTTKLEEPRFDNDGRAIYDLEAKEKIQKTNRVLGLVLYILGDDGLWQLKSEEPRSNPVGPIEIIGSTVIFATQTEPEHQEGVELDLPNRYPYPAVVLRGLSLESQEPWFLELERGLSPAKSRLPEFGWPKLGELGPLVLTSEDNRVLGIEPATGQLIWSSQVVKMDESPPPFYQWKNQLGLVTTSGTTRLLTTLDASDGKYLTNANLTKFFIWEKWQHLLGVVIICLALAGFIYLAGKRELYVRKIAGLQALDEAVGRATEMGKPVLYVTGFADVDDIQTLASLSILSHVAKKTAEYDTPIIATTARSVTYSAAQEVVRNAYTLAGRPDSFMSESVRYITDDQFGYAAGVDGIMLREEPAANFYMGKFYAESLILAETGQAAGAIQMAGTAEPAQLPFFVAACDYTLIGEELFAASAYLSGDPLQVGSLRGQDVGKALFMILLLLCSLWVTFDLPKPSEWFKSKPQQTQSYQIDRHPTAQTWPGERAL